MVDCFSYSSLAKSAQWSGWSVLSTVSKLLYVSARRDEYMGGN